MRSVLSVDAAISFCSFFSHVIELRFIQSGQFFLLMQLFHFVVFIFSHVFGFIHLFRFMQCVQFLLLMQ